MKKICFIGFGLFTIGGCQRVTISLANELCKKYETHLLSLCEIPKPYNYFVNPKVYIHSFGMPIDSRARDSFKMAFKVLKFLNSDKIDILFIAGSLPIPLVAIIKPFLRCKVIFCDHENIYGRDKKSIFFRKIACKISDKVVVLTKQILNDYKDILGVKESKLEQIYNSIDCSLAKKCNLNSNKILSVGRISSEKGFDMAVDIAEKIFKNHSDWLWDVYGDGPDFQKISKKIKDLNLENNFFLRGATSNIMEKYKDYSIFVLPSYREGFAIVLLEAKLNSVPIVSFNCNSGPGEIISDGVDGYLIPCYNKDEMSEKICELINSYELRKSFSNHSQDNLDKFNKNSILKKWSRLIERI